MNRVRVSIRSAGLWAIVWTLVSLVFVRIEVADAARAGFAGESWEPWIWAFSAGYAYAVISPAILYFCKKWPLDGKNLAATLLKLLALYVPTALLFTSLMLGLRHVAYFLILGEPYPIDDLASRYVYEFPRSFFLFFSVAFVAYAYIYQAQANEQRVLAMKLNSELNAARLQALRDQLQPHFLFNTLNLISNRMYETPEVADRIMANLGNLLRYSLQATDRPFVTLEDELEAMQNYVDIVRYRFGDRLSLRQQIANECKPVEIPSMLLQPLLENAVKYGVEPSASGGEIEISANLTGESLVIRVANPVLECPSDGESFGIGLENVRVRLRHLYGDSASLTFESGSHDRVLVSVTLPARLAADA